MRAQAAPGCTITLPQFDRRVDRKRQGSMSRKLMSFSSWRFSPGRRLRRNAAVRLSVIGSRILMIGPLPFDIRPRRVPRNTHIPSTFSAGSRSMRRRPRHAASGCRWSCFPTAIRGAACNRSRLPKNWRATVTSWRHQITPTHCSATLLCRPPGKATTSAQFFQAGDVERCHIRRSPRRRRSGYRRIAVGPRVRAGHRSTKYSVRQAIHRGL